MNDYDWRHGGPVMIRHMHASDMIQLGLKWYTEQRYNISIYEEYMKISGWVQQ